MTKILCLETGSKNCSVALFENGLLLRMQETSSDQYVHAEKLHLLVQSVLNNEVPDAIAVGKGPGSYTGLRIGVSAAKGLCYAWQVPLIAVGSTDILHAMAKKEHPDREVVAMIDARRMEVYTRRYNSSGLPLEEVNAAIVNEEWLNSFLWDSVFVGDGANKINEWKLDRQVVINTVPSSAFMGELSFEKWSQKEFENVAYFEPFYLKEFMAGTPNIKGL